tara:strand:+ start:15622 stop:17697 length:2076 start_codon:yes stop_codon:yes gene_type:complete
MADNSFFEELRKRRVIKAAAIYGAIAWGITEIVVTVVDYVFLPPWLATLAVLAFIVGFPIAMFLAWTFDITADGVRRTEIRSGKGRLRISAALALLFVTTLGLFMLIKPAQITTVAEATRPNSIAVMPFENLGGNPADDYIVTGLADELRNQLGQVSGLHMAARSSSIAARTQALGARDTSQRLGVAVLVEGNVRRKGAQLLVSVELVDGKSGLLIWNDSFSQLPQELLTVQQSITDKILLNLATEAGGAAPMPVTLSASANELMWQARYFEQQVREQLDVDTTLLSKAIELYQQATAADPQSAIAQSRLARALMYANDFAAAEAPIFRAVTLNPNLSEVQNTLGNYYLATGVRGAGNALRKATLLNPNNADALADYAWWLWMQSRADEAEPLYREALSHDRLSLSRYGALADFYGYTAMIPEALEIAGEVERNFKHADGYRLIARIMELVGRLDESIAWTIRARNLEPENADHVTALAELYAEIGDFDSALRNNPEPNIGLLFKMGRYRELVESGEFLLFEQPEDLELQILLSYSYTVLGQPELAVRLLTLAGVADRALGETRHPKDVEGLIALIDALDAAGEKELAQELSTRWMARPHLDNEHWWVHIYVACPLAILGRKDKALAHLTRAGNSARLPWDSLIRDMRCFQRYADEPRYQKVLAEISTRRQQQLARLPRTLAEFGLSTTAN